MPVKLLQLLPELILILTGCGLLLLGIASNEKLRRCVPAVALGAVIAACAALVLTPSEFGSIGGGLRVDSSSEFVRNTTLIMAVLLILVGWTQPSLSERGEYFAMMLFSLAGLMLTSLSDNLIMLFLSLELVSIPTYVLVTLSRTSSRSLEAGTKYFYLGAMSAAIMAFGMSYLYGATGSASMNTIDVSIAAALDPEHPAFALAAIGLVLTLAGLMFKIAAVPMHFYIADVYQGAAGPVAGFLGFVPKLAGFVAIFKIISLTEWAPSDAMFWTLWIVAVVTMTVGNVLALMQTNVRRMLAYSGIAHSGYMLVAVLAGPDISETGGFRDGFAAVLYYSVIYGIANLAAFAVLSLLRVRGRPAETLRDLAGLLRRNPGPALLMALAMFTLMGLPPTPGFWGKMSLFGSALSAAPGTAYPAWMIALVVIALVNSAVAAAYYLRVIAACLLYESDRPATTAPRELLRMGAAACGFLLLIFAFAPGILLKAGRDATRTYRERSVVLRSDAAAEAELVDATKTE
ncbi:MAG: NADH-quinone oxidoreductase subunit N [Planctomycetes bacterium]|nr:NADH-quinone oxidoreductase subunit N [Planctomycetota bacterium]